MDSSATTENNLFCPRYSREPATSHLEQPHLSFFLLKHFSCFIYSLVDYKLYKNYEFRKLKEYYASY